MQNVIYFHCYCIFSERSNITYVSSQSYGWLLTALLLLHIATNKMQTITLCIVQFRIPNTIYTSFRLPAIQAHILELYKHIFLFVWQTSFHQIVHFFYQFKTSIYVECRTVFIANNLQQIWDIRLVQMYTREN